MCCWWSLMIFSKLNRREAMNDESSACHGYVCPFLFLDKLCASDT